MLAKLNRLTDEILAIDERIKIIQRSVERVLKPQLEAAKHFLTETEAKVAKTQTAFAIFNKKVEQAECELDRLVEIQNASQSQKDKEHAITNLMQSQIEMHG